MIYLLDVNVLLAVGYSIHLATCSITELGFVRVASGAAGLARNVGAALSDLGRLKTQRPMVFLNDGVPGDQLPEWVAKPKQVTDGHLLQLATVYGGVLATLDGGIPGSLLIPPIAAAPLFVREPTPRYGGPLELRGG